MNFHISTHENGVIQRIGYFSDSNTLHWTTDFRSLEFVWLKGSHLHAISLPVRHDNHNIIW